MALADRGQGPGTSGWPGPRRRQRWSTAPSSWPRSTPASSSSTSIRGLPAGDWAVLWANASLAADVRRRHRHRVRVPGRQAADAAVEACAPCVAGAVSRRAPSSWGCSLPSPSTSPSRTSTNPLPALPDALGRGAARSPRRRWPRRSSPRGSAARYRFVRSVQPQRQQLLWLAASAWLIPTTLAVCFVDLVVPGQLDWLVLTLLLLTITAVPASIAVALLRYRLYDLDRLVNRTLVYGVLTALVLAAYYVTVLGSAACSRDAGFRRRHPRDHGVVVVAVNPLRVWLQRRVDRLHVRRPRRPVHRTLPAGCAPRGQRDPADGPAHDRRHRRRLAEGAVRRDRPPWRRRPAAGRRAPRRPAPPRPARGPVDLPGRGRRRPWSSDRGPASSFTTADRRLLELPGPPCRRGRPRHPADLGAAGIAGATGGRAGGGAPQAAAGSPRWPRADLAGAVFQVDIARDALPADAGSADSQLGGATHPAPGGRREHPRHGLRAAPTCPRQRAGAGAGRTGLVDERAGSGSPRDLHSPQRHARR